MRLRLDIPYVPSAEERVKMMVGLADVRAGQKVVDLGAGDGRVLIALARRGAFGYGFEIEPARVQLARQNIKKARLEGRVQIFNISFWEVDLSDFDIVVLYGIPSIMRRLGKKLNKELLPGTKIVSNFFTFRDWTPVLEKNNVHLYIKN